MNSQSDKIYQLLAAFKGEENNPLLAPRGVCFVNDTLVVSDTGQNRIFIWQNFQFDEYQQADVVLGQATTTNTERNAGDNLSASTLQYPSGIWTDGNKLIAADAWNHRVLIWHNLPTQHGQAADVVIGQKDFISNLPNVEGLSKPCSAQSLYWPYGVYSNGTALWIADTGNRRVLYFDKIPTTNFCAADNLIGQDTFFDRDFDNKNAVWPYSVKINNDGSMLIADTQFYRTLYWKQWEHALTQKAELIFGQPDLDSSGQNQTQLKPSAHTLNWCYDACFFKKGIAIADTGNSRIVIHNSIPLKNNMPAQGLIGQQSFEINGESSLSFTTNIKNEMYWPFAVNAFEDTIIIADTGNHQILFYK
ncbi:MAG: hypothetical protein ACKO1T_09500 [Sediminibacterium sp.]